MAKAYNVINGLKICNKGHQYELGLRQCPACQKQRDYEHNKTPARKFMSKMKQYIKYWPGCTAREAYANYLVLFESQKGCCGWCGRHQKEFDKALAVDHDKNTGTVRKLLCLNCNRRIVGDHTEETALKLLSYLKGA